VSTRSMCGCKSRDTWASVVGAVVQVSVARALGSGSCNVPVSMVPAWAGGA